MYRFDLVKKMFDVTITGGWWHLNWGGRAHGNDWCGIGGMVSNTWFPGV